MGITSYLFQTVNPRAESASSKELAKEIQKIKDAGEPTTIEELLPPDILDNENGALVYNQAFSLLEELKGRYKEEWRYVPYEGDVKWNEAPEAGKEKVRNLLLQDPDFARFYQLLEKASVMKCCFLKREEYQKGVGLMLPHLASLRSCARMLAARTDIRAEKDEVDNALRDCLTGLKISDSLSEEPILITGLVRIAIDQIALARMEEVMKKGKAKIEMYQTLMEKVEKKRNDKMLYQALLTERVVFGMTEFPRLKSGIEEKKDIKPLVELFSGKEKDKLAAAAQKDPVIFIDLFEENELTYFQTMAKFIALSKLPYLEVREKITGLEKELLELPEEKAVLVKLLTPGLSSLFIKKARFDAQLGNAEIALACHLYKTNNKNYPVSLKELSPESLSEPPLDPFTGKDYIYKKKCKGFIVYSVGDNLKDDGGISQNVKKWQGDFDIIWEE